jgi:hypothetical protein
MVQPWNTVSARALSEDVHLPFETHSLAPEPRHPTRTPAPEAAPAEPTTPHRAA